MDKITESPSRYRHLEKMTLSQLLKTSATRTKPCLLAVEALPAIERLVVASCRSNGIATGCITCNPNSPLAFAADYPVEVVVGPEFVTASTRMKAGTAQKLARNMVSTSLMIQLGRVVDNRMVDMQLTNDKLLDRGTMMVVQDTGLDYEAAQQLLRTNGSVRKAVDAFRGR
ncbi:MAG: hypothetical protein IPN76_34955 [Saprospiraceae bacterium]|nr:hypothetical protein [Saprospiraceae bacterium]